MNGLAAIVPFRGLEGGKQRLRPLFDERQRATLTRRMLASVIGALAGSGVVASIGVVTLDIQVELILTSFGSDVAMVTQSLETPGLIGGLESGLAWARDQGMTELLVVSADLPLLTGSDLRHLVARDAAVVIAPDRHLTGTNALLLRLDSLPGARPFRFKFGIESFARHAAEAERQGVETAIMLGAGTMFDLDTPDDWRDLPVAVQQRLLGEDSRDVVTSDLQRECAHCL
jgi:2-phospho-L-lactate guanylyltransferase